MLYEVNTFIDNHVKSVLICASLEKHLEELDHITKKLLKKMLCFV